MPVLVWGAIQIRASFWKWRRLQSQATLPVQMCAATIGLAVIGCYVLIHLLAIAS